MKNGWILRNVCCDIPSVTEEIGRSLGDYAFVLLIIVLLVAAAVVVLVLQARKRKKGTMHPSEMPSDLKGEQGAESAGGEGGTEDKGN